MLEVVHGYKMICINTVTIPKVSICIFKSFTSRRGCTIVVIEHPRGDVSRCHRAMKNYPHMNQDIHNR